MDLARDKVTEATAELKAAESAIEACREKLTEANAAVRTEERAIAQGLVEVTVAGEQAQRCQEAEDLLKRLEAGPEPEAPASCAAAAAPDVEMAAIPVAAGA